ncbi:hypothetical protein MK079_03635 [Candidatus Gracilibacteria bacterium]|nr:hypothetical protein [Candidatus Gracilibacteria bacterium]
MENFIRYTHEDNGFECVIDTKIFSQEVVLKTAFGFLEKAYFFFQYDTSGMLIVQCYKKDEAYNPKNILLDFSDELLNVTLRVQLEERNKTARDAILLQAFRGALDPSRFVQTNVSDTTPTGDSDDLNTKIAETLKELENDPELQLEEAEIKQLMESARSIENERSQITLDPKNIINAKKSFSNRSKDI